jgi:23S rRNA pseudouridine2605 synthase/collagen type XVIII alpha
MALLVVADEVGFVGAFSSPAKAKELVFDRFPAATLLTYEFRAEPGPATHVWVVYYTNNAIACATSSEERALGVHRALAAFGLAYEDDIGHWKHPIDQVQVLAAQRLATRGTGAHGEVSAPEIAEPEGAAPCAELKGGGPQAESAAPRIEPESAGPASEPAGPEPRTEPEGAGPRAEPEGAGPQTEPGGAGPRAELKGAGRRAEPEGSGSRAELEGAEALNLGLLSVDLRLGGAQACERPPVSPLE